MTTNKSFKVRTRVGKKILKVNTSGIYRGKYSSMGIIPGIFPTLVRKGKKLRVYVNRVLRNERKKVLLEGRKEKTSISFSRFQLFLAVSFSPCIIDTLNICYIYYYIVYICLTEKY